LLALEVNIEEEDKTLLLLSSLSSTCDHLATTIMYDKKTLELEDVRQMLQNNELMKKTDFTDEASGLVVKTRREDHRVGDPKGIQRLLIALLAFFIRNQDTSRKIV